MAVANITLNSSVKDSVALFFINTDAKSGASYHEKWLARGIAVTSGPMRYRNTLAKIAHGDTVLMYVNSIGVIAVGTVLDEEVFDVTAKRAITNPTEKIEYHRRVDWICDLRSNPISVATLWDVCGRPPRVTVERAEKGQVELQRLIGAHHVPRAQDMEAPPPSRVKTTVSRIVRDTACANRVKALHNHKCQLCGHTIELPDGSRYAEAHHVRPLGAPHDGPDITENILCLCPNHHAECDLAAIRLVASKLRRAKGHKVDERFIDYHNELFSRVNSV